jgi:hypothetical protein
LIGFGRITRETFSRALAAPYDAGSNRVEGETVFIRDLPTACPIH